MKKALKIVCDANMPFGQEAFSTLGEVLAIDGREIRAEHLRGADVLITRSTTLVDEALLTGSHLRFYGSAVIGTDHVDAAWLARAGVPWQSAPGCNAESVANYVTAALLWLGARHRLKLAGRTLGVVGVGHIGRRVCAKGRALGLRVIACDPPRQRDLADSEARDFLDLDELLASADVVSLHVPLTEVGEDRTRNLIDGARLARLRPGAILINAARGGVLDGDGWLAASARGTPAHTVLDTWEPEPAYRVGMLQRADLGTPHIAGHSFEGKANGTMQVYRAACRTLGLPATFEPQMPPPPVARLDVDAAGLADEELLRRLVLAVYDIAADDAAMRASCQDDEKARASAFNRLRRDYPMRREFAATQVTLTNATPAQISQVRALGFHLAGNYAGGDR